MEPHEWSACETAGEHQITTRHPKAECPVHQLPDMAMDVIGEYQGGVYPEKAEYRVHLNKPTEAEPDDKGFLLWVEDASGIRVAALWLTEGLVDGVTEMASRDHSLSGYDGDWTIPQGMNREIIWTLPTEADHWVQLNEGHIDEIAMWLRYATGEEEWTGGWEWSY